jgi:hypothetical protein
MERVLATVESRQPAEVLALNAAASDRRETIAAPPPPLEDDEDGFVSRPARKPATNAAPAPAPRTSTDPKTAGNDGSAEYFAQPPRRGFLFISRLQPEKLDSTQISESEAIPLPPR